MPSPVYFKFKNKVRYYGMNTSDVICILVEYFNEGKFDDLFDIKEDKPCTQFQKDLKEFLVKHQFNICKVDEDGELIIFDINPYRSLEFIEGCEKRIIWDNLQKRYDDGER
jgi:hypothetical protein